MNPKGERKGDSGGTHDAPKAPGQLVFFLHEGFTVEGFRGSGLKGLGFFVSTDQGTRAVNFYSWHSLP